MGSRYPMKKEGSQAKRSSPDGSRSAAHGERIVAATVYRILAGLFVTLQGCSAVPVNPPMEKARLEKADVIESSSVKENDNSDALRLARLWEQRKKAEDGGDYPIGPGDVLEVNVAGMEEIKNLSERVTGEGTIALPFVGVIQVNGMTDKTLRAEIGRQLETNYMHQPQVSLFVKEFRSRQVAVIGAVQKPGLYSLASSSDTVLSMISQAGGLTAGASERILFIPADPAEPDKAKELTGALPAVLIKQDPAPLILKDVEPIVINLALINRGGNESYLSLPARPGDVIMVPGGGDVLVQGWVEKPGSYKLTSGLTILGVVAAAGGAMYAGDTSSIRLIRTNKQGQKIIFKADLDAITNGWEPDLVLREGDVIDVASSGPRAVAYGVYRFFTTIMRVGASVPIPLGR